MISYGEKYNLGKLNIGSNLQEKGVFHWYIEADVRFLKTNNKCKKNLSYNVNFHTFKNKSYNYLYIYLN